MTITRQLRGVNDAHWKPGLVYAGASSKYHEWETKNQRYVLDGRLVLLVDYTARLFRRGKAAISAEVAGTFEPRSSRGGNWPLRMEKL